MSFYDQWVQYRDAYVSATTKSLLEQIAQKFPGMEHYWVSEHYGHHCDRWINGVLHHNPHAAHGGFVYCGYLDSLGNPIHGRMWRSTSLDGLRRLVIAEEPDFIPVYGTRRFR